MEYYKDPNRIVFYTVDVELCNSRIIETLNKQNTMLNSMEETCYNCIHYCGRYEITKKSYCSKKDKWVNMDKCCPEFDSIYP